MRLELEESIQAPLPVVFGVFTDLHHAPEHIESITALEVIGKGPVGKGTRFRETRVMFGKETTEEMEISQFDPPRSYMVEGFSCGVAFRTTYTFDSSMGVTTVRMVMESEPRSLFAKIVGPVMGVMMKGAMVKAMNKDHAQLKAVCEARAAEEAQG